MKKFLVVAGMLGGLALPAMAQNWNQYDRNNDGQVSFAELRASGIRVDNNLRALDRNNDRVLSRREMRNVQWGNYQNYQQPYQQSYTTNNNGYHWSNLDTNRNGVLEAQELNQAGYNTNTNYNMYSIDLNRDGYIDQYEQQRANNSQSNNGLNLFNLLQVLPGLLNR